MLHFGIAINHFEELLRELDPVLPALLVAALEGFPELHTVHRNRSHAERPTLCDDFLACSWLALGLLLACSWLALGFLARLLRSACSVSCARLALCLGVAYKSRRYFFHGPPSSSNAMPVLSRFPPNTQAYVHPRILSCVGPAVAMLALWEFSLEVVSSALSMLNSNFVL